MKVDAIERALSRLSWGWRTPAQVVLQTEASECGLACLAMVAAHHGQHHLLRELRQRFPVSLQGMTLARMVDVARRMGFGARAVKLEIEDLAGLKLPCVLHWRFNHFVVLTRVDADGATVLDPAQGERRVGPEELSEAFTGVALELWPEPGFEPRAEAPAVGLRQLMGPVAGLRSSLLQILLLSLALEVFALTSPLVTQWVIDHVITAADTDLLTLLVLGFGLMMLMQQAVGLARSWMIMVLATSLSVQWRAHVFAHLLRLPTDYFERRLLGDVASRFGAVDALQKAITTDFVSAVLDGVMTAATLVMMFLYSPKLGLFSCATMALYAAGRWFWFRPLREATEAEIVHGARQQSHFLESVRGVKAIKLFGAQSRRQGSWLNLLVEQINAGLHTQKLNLLYEQLNALLFGVLNLVVLYVGARLVIDGHFTVGALMAFQSYKGQFEGRLGGLVNKWFEFRMLRLQGERLADIVFTPAEALPSDEDAFGDGRHWEGDIVLQGVRYRYGESDPEVLAGLDLVIARGESVAITGASGCGKTTLLHLLLGLLRPTDGTVRVGERVLDEAAAVAWREQVGCVMQDDVLFAGTLAENIAFFDPQPDMAWVEECARQAQIHDDIVAMPMRFNTLVGEMGSTLSGGQRQRVLLARALYKRPQVLVLDEATSHLDAACEQRVNAAIQAQRITRIVVAHRSETIASSDRVVTLAQGRIVADRRPNPGA
jgi:ATP-binding cassette subfamily B protein RaxB